MHPKKLSALAPDLYPIENVCADLKRKSDNSQNRLFSV